MATQREFTTCEEYDMMLGGREIAYRIYPSLLDKFQSLLDYQEEAEKPWNKWSATSIAKAREDWQRRQRDEFLPIWVDPQPGDYILTPDEKYEQIEQELIDTINREPHEPSEAADKGTAMNEVIDCLLQNRPCNRTDMTIQSIKSGGAPVAIRVDYDGFTFDFEPTLCTSLRDMLRGSICQILIKATIDTKYGKVLLYGYMDYWRADTIIDLKTTKNYSFGNYEKKWQRWVYPYCAIESGLTDRVTSFVYLVAQLGTGKLINGSIYPETYTYNHEDCKNRLRLYVETFIEWLESKRYLIHDKKIFNQLTA